MSAKTRKPNAPKQLDWPTAISRRSARHAPNPLLQRDARWQRFQRFVWDKKR